MGGRVGGRVGLHPKIGWKGHRADDGGVGIRGV